MPRDRIELSTPGFSDQCSTTELPRQVNYHYVYDSKFRAYLANIGIYIPFYNTFNTKVLDYSIAPKIVFLNPLYFIRI